MGPIDYMVDVADPMKMALQGYQIGAGDRQAREAAATQKDQFAAEQGRLTDQFDRQQALAEQRFAFERQQFAANQQAVADARAAAEALQTDYAALVQKQIDGTATADDYKAMLAAHPQLAEPILSMAQGLSKEKTDGYAKTAAQILYAIQNGQPDMALAQISEFAAAARAAGDTEMADQADIWAKMGEVNPALVATGMGMVLTAVAPDLLSKVVGDKPVPLSPEGKLQADIDAGFYKPTDPAPDNGDIQDLRKEWMSIPAVKDFSVQAQAYKRIKASATDPSAAGDIALIFNFMKLLDPNSVVRESEFATAANAGSVPSRIWAQYNKVLSGERLAEETRADFLSRTEKLYGAASENYTALRNQYKGIAERQGFPVDDALPDFNINAGDTKNPAGDTKKPDAELTFESFAADPSVQAAAKAAGVTAEEMWAIKQEGIGK